MSKIIIITDAHAGRNIEPRGMLSGPTLVGTMAVDMVHAFSHYCRQNSIKTMAHLGDEASLNSDLDFQEENAEAIGEAFAGFDGNVIRLLGNHTLDADFHNPAFATSDFNSAAAELGWNILCAQPVFEKVLDSKTGEMREVYYYPRDTFSTIEDRPNPDAAHLITLGHFAFDRQPNGYSKIHPPVGPYAFLDRHGLPPNLFQPRTTPDGTPIQTISLHGHEHRFRIAEGNVSQCIVLPAVTQDSAKHERYPGGVFAEIEKDDETGSILSIEFKRMIIGWKPEQFDTMPISRETLMTDYFRPTQFGKPFTLP